MHPLSVQAISAALAHQWDEAVTLNQKILQERPDDYDALNRLAYAFSELGRYDDAEEIFQRVLQIDPRNLIATKNLIKIHKLKGTAPQENTEDIDEHISPTLFLEEAGKTKTCHLVRIAAKEVIAGLRVGYKVDLAQKNRTVAVLHGKETCIGYLPDDVAFVLSRFMHGGNEYEAFIKSVEPNFVTVFIRETKKSADMGDIPSFIDAKKYSNHTVHKMAYSYAVSTSDRDDSPTEEFNNDVYDSE